jgi:hypothetical protein
MLSSLWAVRNDLLVKREWDVYDSARSLFGAGTLITLHGTGGAVRTSYAPFAVRPFPFITSHLPASSTVLFKTIPCVARVFSLFVLLQFCCVE